MGDQPWLDNLPDDWDQMPETPTSPSPARPLHSPHPSSAQNSPSRIPVPARRPPEQSPTDGKKKITRPCHFIKREPPTPKYRSPKTPTKGRSPVPNKSKKSPKAKPSPARARKQHPPPDTRSPLRAVSNMSSQSGQQDTVQIRPKQDKEGETTPEWRRRLVDGGIPAGEQRDLFAPMGLESVFKPPSPDSTTPQQEKSPMAKQSDDIQDLEGPEGAHLRADGGGVDPPEKPENLDTVSQSNDKGTVSSLDLPEATLEARKRAALHEGLSQNDTHLRTASGLEDLRNEGITPITFSRPNTLSGNATSDIIQSALKQVTNKLGSLSLGPDDRPDSRASDSILFHHQRDPHGEAIPEDDPLEATSHSLPRDLSMGTQESGGRRTFSGFRRKQYLGEESFLKDHLTPSSLQSLRRSPGALANSRIRSSPPFYQRARSADPPSLPRASNVRSSIADDPEDTKAEAMPSSGSPLKLFGDHDTFTNNKLLRRMSQFEETLRGSLEDEPVSPSEEARRKGESRAFLNVRQKTPREPSLRRGERPMSRNGMNPRLSRFGDGQLDDFDFSDTSPYEPKLAYEKFPHDSVRPPSRRRTSNEKRYLRLGSYRNYSLDSKSAYLTSGRSPRPATNRPATSDAVASRGPTLKEALATERSFNSPAAYPNPKRRRTVLPRSTADKENQAFGDSPAQYSDNVSLLQKSLIQYGVDRDDELEFLQPPSAHRPRAPTPNRAKSPAGERGSLSNNRPKSGSKGRRSSESLSERLSVPMVKVTGASEERRKGSITTQDFLSEATKIMDIIRGKGKSPGGLPELEEFDLEDENSGDAYEDESTQEDFERPPSREGGDIRPSRYQKKLDPRVLSHLRKFQEDEDLEFGVSASFCLDERQTTGNKDDLRGSDPGAGNGIGIPENLRIQANIMDARKRKYSAPFGNEEDSKNLSARSIPTGSTQSSHAKGVLSSDLVSHLIPEQVNGLTYDRFKHLWVKERAKQSLGTPRTEDSEDDPFNGIPDLSVDELQELMGIRLDSPAKDNDSTPAEGHGSNSSHIRRDPASPKTSPARPEPRPQTRGGGQSTGSSLQSKETRYTSSVPNTHTRATSWSTDRTKRKGSSSEVEHEIQLHEGRFSRAPNPDDANQQARVVNISFSSPLVSNVGHSDDPSPATFGARPKTSHEGIKESESRAQEGSYRPQSSKPFLFPSRRTSFDGKPFIRRPISRISEGNEDTGEDLSLVRQGNAPNEMTPIRNHAETSLVKSTDRSKAYSFQLTPLGDFTVDQTDKPMHLELSYVAQRTNPSSLRQIHGAFALAIEHLVKHITSAEPHEPYWEHIRRLILRDRGLITLHKLNEFCPRLEDLDVSDNAIGQLSGIPSGLRTLKIQRNYLSSLTAWGHLTNLQYLDVSGNELESLDGFSSLIHLRELRANDNSIQNIDGIFDLNGLLSLKLRNNDLVSVDFETSDLARLSDLDLSCNRLTSVRNIESLPSLATLDLSSNQIGGIDCSGPLRSVRVLKLSKNRLNAFDAGMLPSLSLLYVDQNSLFTIMGLEHCHDLEVLSAREQVAPSRDGCFDIDLGVVADIRKLYLSSNKLTPRCLSPSAPLLSLQLLDFASCNLETLPEDFSSNFPNVKVLNLNFNSLEHVDEIASMNCLTRLGAAGNRIHRLRRTCQVLSGMGRTGKGNRCSLRKVDIRGNPLTMRYYPPPVTGSGKPGNQKPKEREHNQAYPEADLPKVLAELDLSEKTNFPHPITWHRRDDVDGDDNNNYDCARNDAISSSSAYINDPYTLPPADPDADKKHLSTLDHSTKLRRQVLELLLYVTSERSIKYLDGLRLRPSFQNKAEMDWTWNRMVESGVLKKGDGQVDRIEAKEDKQETHEKAEEQEKMKKIKVKRINKTEKKATATGTSRET